jgi:outer membrane receptor protein involved in Fe transport
MGMTFFTFQAVGNPDIGPQTSDNLSAGFDWDITNNISVGASWVSIKFTDQIALPSAPATLINLNCIRNINGVLVDETDTPLTPGAGNDELVFVSVANGGCVLPVDPTAPITVSNIRRVVTAPENREFVNTEQIDLRASFGWDTAIGRLTFVPTATVVTSYELPRGDILGFDETCGPVVCELVGRNPGGMTFGMASVPRWRMTANTRLNFGNHDLRFTLRYTDATNPAFGDLTDDQKATFVRDDGLLIADLNYNYRFNQGTRVSATIQNLSASIPDNASGQFNRRRRVFVLQLQHAFGN